MKHKTKKQRQFIERVNKNIAIIYVAMLLADDTYFWGV
jgi:hypothetical protein